MSLFEYVSVMVSVVLALGIAQILTGIGAFLFTLLAPALVYLPTSSGPGSTGTACPSP